VRARWELSTSKELIMGLMMFGVFSHAQKSWHKHILAPDRLQFCQCVFSWTLVFTRHNVRNYLLLPFCFPFCVSRQITSLAIATSFYESSSVSIIEQMNHQDVGWKGIHF
jgi:hypothetical protein